MRWLRWLLPERPATGWRAVLRPKTKLLELDDDERPVRERRVVYYQLRDED
mgnify:CR=1 FL=1